MAAAAAAVGDRRLKGSRSATSFYYGLQGIGIVIAYFRGANLFQAPVSLGDALYKLVFTLLGATAFTVFAIVRDSDPGYVVKPSVSTEQPSLSRDLESGVEDVSEPAPMCKLCEVPMPLRTRHCRDCDRCVARFDHHCVFIGNCVGLKNHRLFFGFLLVQAVWHAAIIPQLLSCFSHHDKFLELIAYNYPVVPLFIANCVFLMITGALLGYHSYLICTAQTSWEHSSHNVPYLEGVPEDVLAFDRGLAANCYDFWHRADDWPPYRKHIPEPLPDGTYPSTSRVTQCINACC